MKRTLTIFPFYAIAIFWLLSVTPFIALAQSELYPNIITHMSCDALLKGPYTIQPQDIHEFVSNDRIDMKLVIYDGFFQSGITDNLDAIYINKVDYSTLFGSDKPDNAFINYINDFLTKLPANTDQYNNVLIISTYKKGPREIITYFHFVGGRLRAYVHPAKYMVPPEQTFHILATELESAVKQNKQVLWIGDDLTLDIADAAKQKGVVFYRRMRSIKKQYPTKLESYELVFNPAESVVCNAIPHTKSQIVQGGFPSSSQKNWLEYRSQVNNLTSAFAKQVTNVDELKQELLHGESDVFFVIAHLRGSDLYIGDSRVTLEQIRNWGTRTTPTSGKRIGVLCICNSGNQRYRTSSTFWLTKVDPLANILLSNKYFDQVFAPDHTIFRPETLSLISHLTKSRSVSQMQQLFPGWWAYVYLQSTIKQTSL